MNLGAVAVIDPPPFPHDDDVTVQSPEPGPLTVFASSGASIVDRSRDRPRTAPEAAKTSARGVSARGIIEKLRAQVHAIERQPAQFQHPARRSNWTLGADDIDAMLGEGLSLSGVHEIKPATWSVTSVDGGPAASSAAHLALTASSSAAANAAAIGFALRLAVRRISCLSRDQAAQASGRLANGTLSRALTVGPDLNQQSGFLKPPAFSEQHGQLEETGLIVWCWQTAIAADRGRLYGPGLADLGLDPSRLLIIETARAADTLWALEEALRSQSAILVAGTVGTVGLTEARRLSLASESSATPCLLVTGATQPETPAAASRWRIGPMAPPRQHRAESFKVAVKLERWRSAGPLKHDKPPFALEWCDEAHRFRSLANVADRVSENIAKRPARRLPVTR